MALDRRIIAASCFLLVAFLVRWRGQVMTTLLFVPICILSGGALLVIAAVFAAASAEKYQQAPTFLDRQRSAAKPLAFAARGSWARVVSVTDSEEKQPFFEAIYGLESTLAVTRIDRLLGLIRKSFIHPWYIRISPGRAFPDAVERNVRHALSQVAHRAEAVDWPSLVVSRILPIAADHFQHYRSIEHLSSPIVASPAASLPLPLPGNAHAALSVRNHISAESNIPTIEDHLRTIVERMLADLLPSTEQSEVVLTIVREIVLGAVLMPVFNMLCDSDFWNRQIDEQGGRYLHQRKQVNKVLSALSTMPAQTHSPSKSGAASRARKQTTSSITVHSTSRQFDEFMRSIPRLKTLGEARRLRADVDRELRAARSGVKHIQSHGSLEQSQRLERYVHRLEKARSHIDRRVITLSGGSSPRSTAMSPESPMCNRIKASLYTILSDPSSLAYWLEYMDRRDRSHLVQFWLTVEGFTDPLEASGQNVSPLDGSQPSTIDSIIGDDTTFLYTTYFTNSDHKIILPSRLVNEMAELAAHVGPLSPADARRAKRAVSESQKLVYEQMELEDWPGFQKSELYVKAITDLKSSARPRLTLRSVSDSPPHTPSHGLAPPASARRLSDAPRRPILVHGSFSPATTSTPSIATVTTPHNYDLPMRKITPDSYSGRESPQLLVSSLSSPAPRPKNLDFLLGGEGSEERNPLFVDGDEDEHDQLEAERMEAIQAALNEIIASDDGGGQDDRSRGASPMSPGPGNVDPMSMSVELVRPERHPLAGNRLTSRSVEDLTAARSKGMRPPSPPSPVRRVAKLDTRKTTRRRRASVDRPSLHSNKSIFADDADEDAVEVLEDDNAQVHMEPAVPGDMQLTDEIARLSDKIGQLQQQVAILDSLIGQAELTGNQKELKLLHRSRSSLLRNNRAAEFQRSQYQQQEEENRLVPGRTRVSIPSSTTAPDEHEGGRQIVRYNVEIRQVGDDGRTVSTWIVSHRYNEFWELDRALHDWAATAVDPQLTEDVRTKVVDLPGKRLVPSNSASFVETRRMGLEKYLQSILTSTPLCNSTIVRGFLSRTPVSDLSSSSAAIGALAPANIVKSLYQTVASSLDDQLVPSMLDLMSQSLSRQLQEMAGGLSVVTEAMPNALKGAAWKSPTTAVSTLPALAVPPTLPDVSVIPGAVQPLEGETATGSFTAPICDLFIEIFDLKENNWLRRQAIVILLQQVLGGTIERKFRDAFKSLTSEEGIDSLLGKFQEGMWPGGERRPETAPRTEYEKYETRLSASRRLGLLMPDVAANMVGKTNARSAAGRLFGVLQDTRLNQQLVLCVFDEVFGTLFPPPRAKP